MIVEVWAPGWNFVCIDYDQIENDKYVAIYWPPVHGTPEHMAMRRKVSDIDWRYILRFHAIAPPNWLPGVQQHVINCKWGDVKGYFDDC